MPWRAVVAAAVGVYLVLAVLGWARYVVMRPVDHAALAGLVVSTPPPGYTHKPAGSNVVPSGSNPFSTYKAMAKHSPHSTAGYSISWTSPQSSDDSATLLVSYLPSASDAKKVQAQARGQFLSSGSFKAQNYQYAGPLTVAGVPGAGGAVFTATGTAGTPPVAAVVFETGRAQVLELLGQTGTTASTGQTAAALALAEYEHLAKVLPSFHLRRTAVPLVASLIYWGATIALAALAVGIPLAGRRVRRRRDESRRRSALRQHQVRGSKIARRQAPRGAGSRR